MNKKYAVAIGVVGVVAAFVAGLLIVLSIFFVPVKKEQNQSLETTQELVTERQEPETIVVVETTKVVETTQVYIEPSEKDNNNNSNNGSFSGNKKVIEGDNFYIVENTPDNAGLVMRDAPTPNSDKLGVVPEGARVYVYSDDESNNTGYVRVLVSEKFRDVHCYVLRDYLRHDSSGFYSDSDNAKNAHVSYNTPNNAGLNLREEASSSSELICVIESGENVKIADGKIVNGYVRVFYDHPHAGDVYEGWLLEKYLIY